MKRLRILVDMDSIVCDTLPHWLWHLNHRHSRPKGPPGADQVPAVLNRPVKISDITEWDMGKCFPLTALKPEEIFGILQNDDFVDTIPMMAGADVALKQLMDDGHEVYLVTARHGATSMPGTRRWVQKHLPFMNFEKQTIFCYHKHLIPGDVIIDDKAETLINYANTHKDAHILGIAYPYNKTAGFVKAKLFPYGPIAWGMIYGYIHAQSEE